MHPMKFTWHCAGRQHVKHTEPAGLLLVNDPANSILIQLFGKQLPPATERQQGAVQHVPIYISGIFHF